MKKVLLALGSTVMLASATNKATAQSLSLGPVASFGISRITNVPNGADFKPSGALGLDLLYATRGNFGIDFQVLASYEGYGRDGGMIGNNKIEYYNNPLYLRMPLTFNYFFTSNNSVVRPKIYAGPSFGIKLSERSGMHIDGGNTEQYTSTNTDQFKTFDFGLTGGAGVNIRVARNTSLNLDANYYQGVTNVIKNAGDVNYRNQNVRINVGLAFGI